MRAAGPVRATDHDAVVSIVVPTVGPYGMAMEDDGVAGRAA